MRNRSGIAKSMFKDVYYSMRARCEHKNHSAYYRYGGRGITVCKEWKLYPVLFVEWALTNGYKKGLTLDRIDNNKGYCPENCRWITPKEQAYNMRTNKRYEGLTVEEISKVSGIKESTLRDRLVSGRSVKEATAKVFIKRPKIVLEGGKTLKELANEAGINYATVKKRLSRAWPLSDALSRPIQKHKII